MDETKYKSNSDKSKEGVVQEKKTADKVITGNATRKKKGELLRMADSFLSEDIANIKSYVKDEVIIPSIKRAIHDVITNSADMMFGRYDSPKSKKSSGASYISYDKYSSKSSDSYSRPRVEPKDRYEVDTIQYDDRGQAELVLSSMREVLNDYPAVTVANMYEFSGFRPNYVDYNYGWINLDSAEAVRMMNGQYTIRLPKALPLD